MAKKIDIRETLLSNGEDSYKNIIELLQAIPTPPWRAYDNPSEQFIEKCKKEEEQKEKEQKEKSEEDSKEKITYIPTTNELEVVKAAIYLRRPLLVTGKPGLGKSALAKAIVKALDLGALLHWQITTETTLKDALYSYDAIGRLQDIQLKDKSEGERKNEISTGIEDFLKLQALGTAFASKCKPKVLLIDELDKSDADLPNSLLHIFEEGYFEIPELKRLKHSTSKEIETLDGKKVEIPNGKVICTHFPIVIMTSNGERDFPPAFKRRCLHIELHKPEKEELIAIVKSNLKEELSKDDKLLKLFIDKRESCDDNIATDQLLNAVYLRSKGIIKEEDYQKLKDSKLIQSIFKPLVD